jgi:hypothetical protein
MRTVSQVLRSRVRREVKRTSIKRIATETGLPYACVHGFATDDDTGLHSRAVDVLCSHFGLTLSDAEPTRKPKRKK